MSAVHILVVMDKATDLINPLISPEHAALNLQLREARSQVQDLMNSCSYLIKVFAEQDGKGNILEGGLQFNAINQGIATLARCKGESP